MTFLLDTNVCIALLRGRNQGVIEMLHNYKPSDIALCSVVKAELYYGANRSTDSYQSFIKVAQFCSPYVSLAFDDTAAQIAGNIRADLATRGTPIGSNDLHIAAIALAHNLAVVTHNVSEFSRVPNHAWVDWEVSP